MCDIQISITPWLREKIQHPHQCVFDGIENQGKTNLWKLHTLQYIGISISVLGNIFSLL